MKALTEVGHQVSLLTRVNCLPDSTDGIGLSNSFVMGSNRITQAPSLSWLQRRYCSFWGIDEKPISEVQSVAEEIGADVVVAVGLEVLPYLAGVTKAKRVWYAADEWVLHHLSQVSIFKKNSWNNLRAALIKGIYERAFANKVDRVWVVSKRDALATRLVMHRPAVDIIVNGVDADHFAPAQQEEIPFSCVFWGRLDFGPNIDAIRWFAANVWPQVKSQNRSAQFTIYGFQPGIEVQELVNQHGFILVPDMPDIRAEVGRHQVVVLPFVSGAGIKNKLLEAAALARPILASKTAMNGVDRYGLKPFCVAQSTKEWISRLSDLWQLEKLRQEYAITAREWVVQHYTWEAAARKAVDHLPPAPK